MKVVGEDGGFSNVTGKMTKMMRRMGFFLNVTSKNDKDDDDGVFWNVTGKNDKDDDDGVFWNVTGKNDKDDDDGVFFLECDW